MVTPLTATVQYVSPIATGRVYSAGQVEGCERLATTHTYADCVYVYVYVHVKLTAVKEASCTPNAIGVLDLSQCHLSSSTPLHGILGLSKAKFNFNDQSESPTPNQQPQSG